MGTAAPETPPPAGGAAAPAAALQSEMFRNYNFIVELPIGTLHFTECLGLGMRIEPVRYRESGAGSVVRVLPGPVAYSEVILRYGLGTTKEIWAWLTETGAGRVVRHNASVTQLNNDGTPSDVVWHLKNAWPCQWNGVPFDALGREVAIEELRLAYDELDRA
jgi:phage tail-like protein